MMNATTVQRFGVSDEGREDLLRELVGSLEEVGRAYVGAGKASHAAGRA